MSYKNAEKQRAFQLNWITARKQKYLQQLCCCFFCGSHDQIEIHHIDPTMKESHKIWSWTDDKIELELRKCVAMCHQCHKRFHLLMKRKAFQHGTLGAYDAGCRCADCRNAKSIDRQNRKLRKFTSQILGGDHQMGKHSTGIILVNLATLIFIFGLWTAPSGALLLLGFTLAALGCGLLFPPKKRKDPK